MTHAHLVAFVAGSLLAVLIGGSLFVRSLELELPGAGGRQLLVADAIRTVLVGALVVVFLSAILAR
ncbi:MAG TPA: hypothetical protein VF763_06320 [Candidatus Limnocylindrales bacterium]